MSDRRSDGLRGGSEHAELDALRRCLRDLVGLLALPSMAHARSPRDALEICLDAIVAAVPVELAYAHVDAEDGLELARHYGRACEPSAVQAWVHARDRHPPVLTIALPPELAPGPRDAGPSASPIRTVALPLAIHETGGQLVIGSRRPDFPTADEEVVLRAGVSLTASVVDSARLLARARDADRRKDHFLALLGHELRNPLAPILTALELIARRAPEVERERAVIERQTRHMIGLVDDLLDVSRITRGVLDLRSEDVRVADVVARAVEMIEPALQKRRHRLHVHVETDLVVRGDAARLAQIVANLLHNAAKFTDPGGNVAIDARRDGERARITVEDDGVGIPPHQLSAIWEPFVQTERRTERSAGGLGLGLALVRSLVELHGGTVHAESGGPGRGSRFSVLLAASAKAERPTTPDAPAPAASPARARVRVLVVDDNEDAAEMLESALTLAGYEVARAGEASGAMASVGREPPAVAVIDIGLPVVDGYELARMIRDVAPAARLIALTGYGTDRDRERAAAAGFDAHLTKPVELDALLRAVAAEPPEAPGDRR